MISRTLISLAFIASTIHASDVFFAPYEGPYPVTLEARFDGYPWHHPAFKKHHDCHWSYLSTAFTLNGYVRLPHNFFYTIGTFLGGGDRHLRMVDVSFQIGKYWHDIGALRGGLMYDGIGIGGDYWLIHKDRFKWLTTLEGGARDDISCSFGRSDRHLRPFVRWSNRVIVFSTLYISFGIDHIHRTQHPGSITQGFLGFGSTI